jgi:hypothetical protein
MSSSSSKNFPALEMAHCPNCGYVIEQLGARTTCSKCGKRITILCISCQTNNPPVFQMCMKCGVDYRHIGVEHYRKQLAKLEFELQEFERLNLLHNRTRAVYQIAQFSVLFIALFISLSSLLFLPYPVAFTIFLLLSLIGISFIRRFGWLWSAKLLGLPLPKQWQQLCLTAEKQQLEKDDLEKNLIYYQRELNQFRQKKP